MPLNRPLHVPRFPCPVAPPYHLLQHSNFQEDGDDIKVYWTDVPEGDFYTNPEAYYTFPPYGSPLTFPKKNTLLRIPRCVRICTRSTDLSGTTAQAIERANTLFRIFVQQVKQYCEKHSIFCQWVLFDMFNTLLPFDVNDPGSPCYFLSDTLNFVIAPDVFDSFITDASSWDGIRTSANAQYPFFPGYRTIINQNSDSTFYPDLPPGEEALFAIAVADAAAFYATATLPLGYEIGPTFSSDIAYMKATIAAHWHLL